MISETACKRLKNIQPFCHRYDTAKRIDIEPEDLIILNADAVKNKMHSEKHRAGQIIQRFGDDDRCKNG